MPMEGFGVFQVNNLEIYEKSVLEAIETGYRLIDTASSYNKGKNGHESGRFSFLMPGFPWLFNILIMQERGPALFCIGRQVETT